MKATLAALLFGVSIAIAISCGGSGAYKSAASPSAAPPTEAGGVMSPSARTQIQQYEDQINADLAKLSIEAPTSPAALCADPPCSGPQAVSVKPSEDPECRPGASQVCTDTCQLANSICDSAQKICEIAKSLGNDTWANDKCTSGNASCDAAHDKCCGCS